MKVAVKPQMPFSIEQFLQVFENYNQAVFPMQAVLVAIALVMTFLAARPRFLSNKINAFLLAFLWLWVGIVYQLTFFSSINPAAYFFGVFFIIQALLFFYEGSYRNRLSFGFQRNVNCVFGLLFIVYALIIYPLIGYALGRAYPSMQTFGVPCPTTIFTFGLLLWTKKRFPIYLLAIPFMWSLIGISAAVALGIREDFGLFIAGVTTVILILYRDRSEI